MEFSIKATPEAIKAVKKLMKKTFPQYRICKCRFGGLDTYCIDVRKHWYNKWKLLKDFEGYPLMFSSKEDAIDWLR